MDELNDIKTDGGLEDGGHNHFVFSDFSGVINIEYG
jgi:hypothetical protein